MSNQQKSKNLPNATSLQGSESGLMRFVLPDGTTTDPSGLDRVPANLSALQAKEMHLLTSGICSRTGYTSSTSADLEQFLVNKLQARTGLLGSTLFKLTWKQRDTPMQRSIYALRASALRTSDKDSGLSPCDENLTFWPTVTTIDNNQVRGKGAAANSPQRGTTLGGAARLASYPTPNANNWRGAYTDPAKIQARKEAGRQRNLQDIARLMDSGQMQSGSPAKTENIGQLNPALCRWLMGLPPEWDDCAPTEMPSSRKRQKNS